MKTNKIDFELVKLLVFAILLLYICDLYSETYILKGTIRNVNGEPIEFATIQLLFDSVYHQPSLSDSLGNYYLKATKRGDCKLLITILGYKSAQNRFTIKNDTTVNFVLRPDTNILSEVSIIGHRDLIQVKSDRYVINIAGNIETKGKETSDILKQLPTVNISKESLNIFGKSSVIVYINDRIVRLEGQSLLSYLNSLPPDIINSVEIISTPPAQYDAEGNVGIIKIVTKKNIQPGWKEIIKVNYVKNNYSSCISSIYASYIGKKMFFEGTINGGQYTYLNQNEYYNYFPDQTVTTFNPKKWSTLGSRLLATLGYNFNENSNINVSFQAPLYHREEIYDLGNQTNFIDPVNNQIDSILYSNGKTVKNNYTYNSEVFFKHRFSNKKSYFTASAAYLDNKAINSRSFTSLMRVNSVDNTNEDYYTNGSMDNKIFTSKLDFSFPFFSCSADAGFKLSFIKTSSDNNFFYVLNDEKIIDTTLSSNFIYREQVQSLYYTIEKNISNWSFKGGVRSEITETTDNSIILENKHHNSYMNFFPSIYISHQFKNKNNISLSFTDRIERPPFQYLDPFKWYISKYDYAVGNPYLKPSYIRNVELNYLFKNNFSTKLYFTNQDKKIGQYVILDSLNIKSQIQKTDNFLNVNTYGLNIYELLKLYKWQETVLQGDFAYSEYLSNKKEFSNVSGLSSSIIMNNTFFLNKKIQLVCNVEEDIPGLYNYRSTNNSFELDVGLNYIHSKKGFEARLFVSDIFKTSNPAYFYISDGIKQTFHNYYDSRALLLTLTWRLGNWYNRTPQKNSLSNLDENQRL